MTSQNLPQSSEPLDSTPEPEAPVETRNRFRIASFVAAGLLLAGTLGTVYYLRHVAPFESTDDAFVDGQIIGISPQVSGLVAAVHIRDNQMVRKGDLLVELGALRPWRSRQTDLSRQGQCPALHYADGPAAALRRAYARGHQCAPVGQPGRAAA